MRYCLGFNYDYELDDTIVEQYYCVLKTLPDFWRCKMRKDGWTLNLTKYLQKKDSNGIQIFELDKQIRLFVDIDYNEQQKIIYNAFAGYIMYQYQAYNLSIRYIQLSQKYIKQISVMHKLAQNRYEDLFSLLVYFYLKYDKKYFEKNEILELYEYIDEWMSGKVFTLPQNIEWTMNFAVGRNIPYDSINMMNDAMQKISNYILKDLEQQRYVFLLVNDDNVEKNSNDKTKWDGLYVKEERKIFVKTYSDIQETLFTQVGYYFYDKYISVDFNSDRIYKDEKKKMRRVEEFLQFTEDVREYYAKAYAYYFTRTKYLKKYMPMTYNIIEAKLKKVIKENKIK